jgi:glutaminyl-tRNA synthetase
LKPDPEEVPEGADFLVNVNPHSLEVLNAKVEPLLATAAPGSHYQFERLGYFVADTDSTPALRVFNRTVALKDSWAKIEQAQRKTR